jgi:large subunit ribosomal protein L34
MAKTIKLKKRKRAKTHGFLRRKSTPGGRKILKKRRQRGKKKLAS